VRPIRWPPVFAAGVVCRLVVPGLFAWGLSLLSMLAYALLFAWHLPWPLQGSDAAYAFSLHLVGMWLTFALSALLITSFVSWLARQLAAREAALAAAGKPSCAMNNCWRWACRRLVLRIPCPPHQHP
jgi:two-component system sensor histidine kinase RegB